MKVKSKWIAIILGVLLLIIQQWRYVQLEDTIGSANPVDTVVLQGTIDTINVIDTVTKYKSKIVNTVDTVIKEDVVILYDTTTIYKKDVPGFFAIRFVDSTKNPFVSVFGQAEYPSGLVTLIYKNKITLKGLENKMRFYSGLGYDTKAGLFTTVSVSKGAYQAQCLLHKQGIGFSLGKKF